jgi:hypothetical protein
MLSKAVSDLEWNYAYVLNTLMWVPPVLLWTMALSTLGIITVGILLCRRWIKRKGFRMIQKDRNDKIHALLLDILQDGILAAEVAQKISSQEVNALFMMLQKKLGLNDLVPKKRLLRIVKENLKRTRAKRIQAGGEKPSSIPGDKPTPIVRGKFSKQLGKSVSKFWQKA